MQETQVQSMHWEDPLEKEMATHQYPSWKIPRAEDPGRLQSLGSQTVRHDWGANTVVQILGSLFPPPFSSYAQFISHVPNYDMPLLSLFPILKILFLLDIWRTSIYFPRQNKLFSFWNYVTHLQEHLVAPFHVQASQVHYVVRYLTPALRIPQEQRSWFSYLCINNTKTKKHGTQLVCQIYNTWVLQINENNTVSYHGFCLPAFSICFLYLWLNCLFFC